MALYSFKVIDRTGKKISGEREADSTDEVVKSLYDKGYTIISVDEKLSVQFSKILSGDIGGIPLKEKLMIAKQLSTMISAGIPIIQAIDILVQQTEKASLKSQLLSVYKSIEAGSSLSNSFKKQKGIFNDIHINLMAAGEKSANLNEMLNRIAEDLEKNKNLRGKITGALIYPAIIFIVLIIVFFLMVTTMIPQVKELYKSLGKDELPFITELLLSIGNIFTNPLSLTIIVLVIVSIVLIYRYLYKTESGRTSIDRLKLKVPIFGLIISKYEIVQFCRIMSMLLKSGVPIIDSINIVANSSDNKIFKDILLKSVDEVTKGTPLSVSMAKLNEKNAFPSILIKIMSSGEESGKLDQILEDMGKYYESELEQLSNNLTKLMEPLIMVLAGGMVAFLAISVYLPIFQVGDLVG